MIRQHEAPVHAPAPAGAAQPHPPAGERVARLREPAAPGAALHARRRDHQRASQRGLVLHLRDGLRGRQGDARIAVGAVDRLDRPVHDDRADARLHARQEALRLAEAVGHQQARPPRLGIGAPPGIDLGEHRLLGLPAVDRQAERGFGDEAIAADRLEGIAGRVRLDPVVARDDPHAPGMLDAHLGRSEDMPGRVERNGDPPVHHALAPAHPLHLDVAQARPQHAHRSGRREVMAMAGAGVVCVGMGDDGAIHGAPGVDVEVARRAVKPARRLDHQVLSVLSHAVMLLPRRSCPRPAARAQGCSAAPR